MKNTARRALVSMLCAAAFLGVAATSAQAATIVWVVKGPEHTSAQPAFDEIPPLEAKCVRDDGVPESTVTGIDGQPRFWATVTCWAKRA